jgi:hypothetical protein
LFESFLLFHIGFRSAARLIASAVKHRQADFLMPGYCVVLPGHINLILQLVHASFLLIAPL